MSYPPGQAGPRKRSNVVPIVAAVIAGVLLIVGIRWFTTRGDDSTSGSGPTTTATGAPPPRDGCTRVTVAASSEKAALLQQMAQTYHSSGRTVDGKCFDVQVNSVASGTAEANLAQGWDEALDGPAPDAWTPAASTWVSLLASDLTAKDRPTILPAEAAKSIVSTPLVLAMPEPMARALGWPDAQIGWSDVLALAKDPQGWAAKGHPEWGRFTLGKTNPTVSTSGLAATIGTLVAATGTSSDLTEAALQRPEVQQYLKDVETAVIHYGDTTLTYLTNLQHADDSGAALGYVSAVAVEEKSVLDYNAGNPSGNPATLGDHAPPKVPLVAVYPKEGTLYSDSPFVILDAPWSTADKQAGAQDFMEFLLLPEQQKVFTEANFRTADHQPGEPITSSPYLIADGVTIALNPPGPSVLRDVRALWTQVRKPARVLVVMDVSGSMASESGYGSESKLDLAKKAATSALGQLTDTDQMGLWAFTTDLPTPDTITADLVGVGPLAQTRQPIIDAISSLTPLNGTPLYAATREAAKAMNAQKDPNSINAVVVLTDGRNEYTDNDLDGLLRELNASAEEDGVRVFTIAYGPDADLATLQEISEASRAAAYDARNPTSIDKVFSDVLSNF
ncbi:substrate-binding and vWA domain-containing protein [Nakamurella multipartita]|uniref:von Willebrand factor type A n=1 Tax=Nakamurella multipartita (strain ATCC 700099 / DSM 44233 / CIP 104796 / JCM 9543 / NBRC 105858 / Y-104) TaxID=479431 RepID=C8XH18_NAKMY|nr:substrate-binding and VWA domain-containing protein [Nakamurella multipartita]ACV80249.1 von Willebrand factor type A [Nakamurella multipartita DSM 44233]